MISNETFFNTHCKSGVVVLVGGSALIDRGIKKAQKAIQSQNQTSLFSHAFIVSEKRMDGKWWVLESDLEFHTKQIKLGVQENRLDKYFSELEYPNIAIIDFALNNIQTQTIIAEGLNQVANRATYSMREIFGVLLSFTKKELRHQENKFAQENAFICSSFVQHCYETIGVNFNEEVALKHLTPEDIYQTQISNIKHELLREKAERENSKLL